jgi:hypothetical protein
MSVHCELDVHDTCFLFMVTLLLSLMGYSRFLFHIWSCAVAYTCLLSNLIVHIVVSENPARNVFAEVLDPLEKHGAPLDTTWGLMKTLYLTNKDLMPGRTYVTIHDKARQSRAVKFNSEPVYRACKVKYSVLCILLDT